MKVLHININDYMGAGLCAYRINKSLQGEGVNSKMLVVNKKSNDPSVYSYGLLSSLFYKIINRLLYILHLSFTENSKLYKMIKENKTAYSLPISHIDLSKHPLVNDADIIHLHWVNGMLDYPSFFEKVKKPVVWTLHDENMFCGIAHYKGAILNCSEETKYAEMKYKAIKKIKNLNVVFLSNFLSDKFKDEAIISGAKKYIINNSVDCTLYRPKDKLLSRKILGLSSDDVLISFIAYDIAEERKGLYKLVKALELLKDNHIKIIAVGKCGSFEGHKNVITLGSISNPDDMSTAISASDLFAMPSTQEAFAQTPIEAMACGIPAIVTPVSGTKELITEYNGVICNGFSVVDIAEGIKKAMKQKYDPKIIRKDVMERFSPRKIAQDYIDLYNKILEE